LIQVNKNNVVIKISKLLRLYTVITIIIRLTFFLIHPAHVFNVTDQDYQLDLSADRGRTVFHFRRLKHTFTKTYGLDG